MDDKFLTLRVPRKWMRIAMIVGVTTLIVAPLTAVATHSFTDVPNSNTFHADIEWLSDAGVTLGCNPPTNDEYCPDDNVSRAQMAAFMRRLAENRVVDARSVGGQTLGDLVAAGPGLVTSIDDAISQTTSTSYTNVPNMSAQFEIPPGEHREALINFSAVVDCNQNPVVAVWCYVRVLVDGAPVWDGQFSSVQHGPNDTSVLGEGSHSLQALGTNLAPGSHTVTVQYRVDEPNSTHQMRDKVLSIVTFPTSVASSSISASGTASEEEK